MQFSYKQLFVKYYKSTSKHFIGNLINICKNKTLKTEFCENPIEYRAFETSTLTY